MNSKNCPLCSGGGEVRVLTRGGAVVYARCPKCLEAERNTRPPTAADGVTDAQVDAALIAHWGPDALSPRLCSKGDRTAMRAALAAAMGVRHGGV